MKYLFGPVNSRRYGISLGIDLTPYKTCSLDCIYCECGKTTVLTTDTKEYISTKDVIAELDEFLAKGPKLDVVTFSGSGEPTLHKGIGKIIYFLKEKYPQYKILLLTNGTLFSDPDVRKRVLAADIIAPSLDAADDLTAQKILRPAKNLLMEDVIQGLVDLRKEFTGLIYLEIFVAPGINDSLASLNKIKEAALKIKPDLVQLNSIDRPGTESNVQPLTEERINELLDFFSPLKIVAIGKPQKKYVDPNLPKNRNQIFAVLKRRPSTLFDLADALGISVKDVTLVLRNLEQERLVEKEEGKRGIFYKLKL